MTLKQGTFNTENQHKNISGKIIVALERISEAFRVLLWEQSNRFGLSPIQIQILIFLKYHSENLSGVSALAQEFNMSKATISDAVKSLEKKGHIKKSKSINDSRSYVIHPTASGNKTVHQIEDFANPLKDKVDALSDGDQSALFSSLLKIVYELNKSNILTVQRTCFSCKFYQKDNNQHYCNLLKSFLPATEIRIDCPEYELK